MPFMKGRGALRRTMEYLEKGKILLRDDVRVLTFQFNPGNEHGPHSGLYNFVFWHLPQLKFKNPSVQLVTFKMLTPSPWIRAYLEDDSQILVDCHSRSREEIHDHVKIVLGKTDAMVRKETREESAILSNPANFGFNHPRQCICEIPGQVPCPGWQPLPKELTGKWQKKMRDEAEM